jgi:hypothetical protein
VRLPLRARSVPPILLLLYVASPESLAAQLISDTPALTYTRKGMWFNGWLGYGAVDCRGAQTGGLSGGAALGWTLSPQLLLGVGTTDWTRTDYGDRLIIGTLDVRAQFYPEMTGGFFLTGGVGIGYFLTPGTATSTQLGRGVVIGLGYDARIGEKLSITTFINGFGVHTRDPRAHGGQIGVGLTFH